MLNKSPEEILATYHANRAKELERRNKLLSALNYALENESKLVLNVEDAKELDYILKSRESHILNLIGTASEYLAMPVASLKRRLEDQIRSSSQREI